MVGDDQFGHILRNVLHSSEIDDSHLYQHSNVHTTLAFVHRLERV